MVEEIDLETRRKIYNHILKSPGLHKRELSRVLNIPLSTLDYHLRHLEGRNIVTTRLNGRYARFYVVEDVSIENKKLIAILRQNVPRRIIMFLLLNPHSHNRDLCNHLGLAPSTVSFHLVKLLDLGVVKRFQSGREKIYSVEEPGNISDLLITYRRSFLDKSVDKFIEIWLELNPDYIRKPNRKK